MRLGIDLDGVVADFDGAWIDRYNAEFNTAITPDAVSHWDVYPEITHFADMRAFWRWVRRDDGPGIFRRLQPYDGAIAALHDLHQARHHIAVLTSRPQWAAADTSAWITEHQIAADEVHLLSDKWRVPCDLYLDDAPHTLQSLAAERPHSLICRFVRPWNRPLLGVTDIADWPAFEALIAHQDR
jgi:5'(3')-deoxyribonucleotidase